MTTETELETVLLVETNALVRSEVAEYLRGCGYHVIEATSAAEALEVLAHHEVEVLISDIDLRDASGFQLSSLAKDRQPSTRVIVTRAAERTAAVANKLCEDGPLEHPYHPQQLVDRIKRMRNS